MLLVAPRSRNWLAVLPIDLLPDDSGNAFRMPAWQNAIVDSSVNCRFGMAAGPMAIPQTFSVHAAKSFIAVLLITDNLVFSHFGMPFAAFAAAAIRATAVGTARQAYCARVQVAGALAVGSGRA